MIDDYGHHPSEITATLKAVKDSILQKADDAPRSTHHGRLVVLFQPHRYTRTRDLLSEFIDSFADADKIILMDIYPAGEKPLPGVNSELLFRGIKETGKEIEYVQGRSEVMSCLLSELKEEDILLTLGAGDVWKIGEEFIMEKKK